MLIIRVGENAKKRKEASLKEKSFSFSDIVLKGSEIEGLKQYFGEDIFGGKIYIRIENWNNEFYRDFLYRHLEDIRESHNIFIIDELDMLESTFTKLKKYAEKSFDCREEKIKESAFYLADLIIKKDKQKAWLEYHRLLNTGEPIESIIGALNYKFKILKNEKDFAENLISISKSHDSLGNARIDLEKFILNL